MKENIQISFHRSEIILRYGSLYVFIVNVIVFFVRTSDLRNPRAILSQV